jgi:hypothetical protein
VRAVSRPQPRAQVGRLLRVLLRDGANLLHEKMTAASAIYAYVPSPFPSSTLTEPLAQVLMAFPKCSHSHVLCRPFSNPWNFAQPIQQSLGIRHTLEADSSITHSPRESPDGLGSSPSVT